MIKLLTSNSDFWWTGYYVLTLIMIIFGSIYMLAEFHEFKEKSGKITPACK